MSDTRFPVLHISSLTSGYGERRALLNVDLSVFAGEVVALIGHNGSGKSSLLKVVFGMLPAWSGEVRIDGRLLRSLRPRSLQRNGVVYVPQGNRVFSELTVFENLYVRSLVLSDAKLRAREINNVLDDFPILKQRLRYRAGTLSGGERQMLALGGALLTKPRLLLLDEPSLGLAPSMVSEVFRRIRSISVQHQVAVLIVEQRVRQVLAISDRVCVLKHGAVSFVGTPNSYSDHRG